MRNRLLGLGVTIALLLSVSVMSGVAAAQEEPPPNGVGPASSTCVQPLGGTLAGGAAFSSCISNHGNVVDLNIGVPTAGGVGTCCLEPFLTNEEGYFVFFNEDIPSFQCFWDTGPVERGDWTNNFAGLTSATNYRVTRSHDLSAWTLEQNFGVNEFEKIQKIVMIYTNNTGGSHTGVRVGRYANPDLEGTNTDDVFWDPITYNSSVTGFDTDFGSADTGLTLYPRSYRADPRTAVETYDTWSGATSSNPSWDECLPQAPVATPTAEGDYVFWGWNELGTVTTGRTKLVVWEYRNL